MKNQNGISLLALIITIIVIIILAAVVVGTSLNTPEQANFATFCSDYAEIQSAVSSRAATYYGEAFTGALPVNTLAEGYTPTMKGAYNYVGTKSFTDPTGDITIDKDNNNLGMTIPKDKYTGNWVISVAAGTEGKVTYTPGFTYNKAIYTTPTESTGI